MDLALRGRRALVTGATRGIGLAIVEILVAEGAHVAFCARDTAEVRGLESRLRDQGATAFGYVADMSAKDDVAAWVTSAAEDLGGIDVYVSNASAGSGRGEAAWQRNFDIDVLGLVRAIEIAQPHLEASSAPSIVIISTTAAVEMFREPNGYGAMKAALLNYSNALSQQLAPKGVRCNVVSPGPVEFPGGAWERISADLPDFYNSTQAAIPLGRLGHPTDVANAVAYLAGAASSYVTGAHLVIDGGFTKRVNF
jgi:3-oxoacyl-[acyl-carrier protein] reductase